MVRYRVLIVDDQAEIRQVLKISLSTLDLKVEVVAVPSAEEAMLVAASGTFDLMISDVSLPGISGLDMVQRVKKRHPNMRLMLMTGVSDPVVLREIEEFEAEAFFIKPIDLNEFQAAVRRSLDPGVQSEQARALEASSSPAVQMKPLPLVDRLEDLRRRAVMGLAAVLNLAGEVVAQAGFLDGVYEQRGLAAGLAGLYGAGLSLAQQIARTDPENLFYVAGKDYHFYIVSINTQHMLVLTAGQPFRHQLEAFNQWLPDEVRALDQLLMGGSLPVDTEEFEVIPEPVREPEDDEHISQRSLDEELAEVEVSAEDQAAIDALFSTVSNQGLDDTDLDAFWNDAAEEGESLHMSDGSISYDEAKDLGLALD